jgi:phosphoribosylamine--glycine ligase
MNVLLVGGGGREHALAWAIGQSPACSRLRVAPGSAGIADRHDTVDIPGSDVDALVRHAIAESYDLVVVGPEAPLVAGLADRLAEAGIAAFGPTAAAAAIEGSKVFAKRFLTRHGIPTAAYRVFADVEEACRYLRAENTEYPLVVKADGLAAGKGVVLAADAPTAVAAATSMLSGDAFGDAGRRIVVEELLRGREASFFVLTDGERHVELAPCQDYKRAGDGDVGPNTGGMGSYSPSAFLDEPTRKQVLREIVEPTVRGLRTEGRPFRGVLYVGLMLSERGPQVLEYNCRFGDPETQVLVPRLGTDWLPLLHACATGALDAGPLSWKAEAAVCVVLAAGGYPGAYRTGDPITGLDRAAALPGVLVFHAGTARSASGGFETAGGRVVGVTALAPTIEAARERAYAAAECITWRGMYRRLDIAADAVAPRAPA